MKLIKIEISVLIVEELNSDWPKSIELKRGQYGSQSELIHSLKSVLKAYSALPF